MARTGSLSLFAFIDAFGWRIIKENGFLDDVLSFKAPLDTVLGYSSTCIPTILTGKMPREHGHFSFFYYSPETSPFGSCRALSLLPRFITRRGRVRRLLSRAIRRVKGYTGYFQIYGMPFDVLPLFDYSEKKDLYQPGGIEGGVPTVFDVLREKRIPFHLSDWRAPETVNFQKLEADIGAGGFSFAYLYLADMDALLHAHGTRSPLVPEKIRWYEERLRRVLELAHERYEEVRLFVFSDHGQADVRELCPLISRVDALGLEFGVDYAAVYDSTMARFWFFREGVEEKIANALRAESRGRLLSQADLEGFGCDFPGKKFGALFYLLDPGVLLCPSFLGESPLAAMHGYDPSDVDSMAMIASNVPPDPLPKGLVDMFDLMVHEAFRNASIPSEACCGVRP
jgi:hypothetical protein